jgi:hypothetical protein
MSWNYRMVVTHSPDGTTSYALRKVEYDAEDNVLASTKVDLEMNSPGALRECLKRLSEATSRPPLNAADLDVLLAEK